MSTPCLFKEKIVTKPVIYSPRASCFLSELYRTLNISLLRSRDILRTSRPFFASRLLFNRLIFYIVLKSTTRGLATPTYLDYPKLYFVDKGYLYKTKPCLVGIQISLRKLNLCCGDVIAPHDTVYLFDVVFKYALIRLLFDQDLTVIRPYFETRKSLPVRKARRLMLWDKARYF